ncbi:tautomerase family protein [Paenibacillus wuxiensis]|uniref:tautomerase family protein n=1 Tax=Paenibacillaceae bacterium P-4 TaxID=3160969 RepID=UPI00406B962A
MTEHDSYGMVYDPTYLNIQRTEDMMFIQLFLNEGRTVDVKERFRGRLSTY